MTAVRKPAVAGQFYAGTESGLREQIEDAFRHDIGPGEIPTVAEGSPDLRSIVSPHAGYPYSGPVAAHGFAAMAMDGTPDIVVIVGPNHRGFGESVAVSEADAWETPLGRVPIEKVFRDSLLETSSVVRADEPTHAGEHSIEVQIPFLQYLYDESVPILPIAMTSQDEGTARELATDLETVLDGFPGSAVLIASTDLTHYEPRSVAAAKDQEVIDQIESLDVAGLYDTIARESVSMCGYGPTATGIAVASDGGASGGTLLRYATSGDTGGSTSEVVGYAAVSLS